MDILRNPKDPLHKVGPEEEKQLLQAFGQVATGHSRDAVINAVLNMLINSIRQDAQTSKRAEYLFDMYMGKARHNLLELHYDRMGKRKNVFPFTQNVAMDLTEFKQKF